jgi:hypothetical protein
LYLITFSHTDVSGLRLPLNLKVEHHQQEKSKHLYFGEQDEKTLPMESAAGMVNNKQQLRGVKSSYS